MLRVPAIFIDCAIRIIRAKEILSLFSKKDLIAEVLDYDLKGIHRGFFRKFRLVSSLRKKHFDLTYAPDSGEGMREEILMNFPACFWGMNQASSISHWP